MAVKDVTKRSLDMLRDLYTVVMGLALVAAIDNLIERSPTASVFVHWDRFTLFAAAFATLLPFYHGALRYLDDVYIFADKEPKRLAFLVDYLFLFCEACLMVGLGLLIARPDSFIRFYATLLGLDVIWTIVSYFSTDRGIQSSWRWLAINLVALILIAVFTWTSLLDRVKLKSIICVILLRTIADYFWCWIIYFPES